jgi:hypothetical protein
MEPKQRRFDEDTTPMLDFRQVFAAHGRGWPPFPQWDADSCVMPRFPLLTILAPHD